MFCSDLINAFDHIFVITFYCLENGGTVSKETEIKEEVNTSNF